MTKIKCLYTGEVFEIQLNPIQTLVRCPKCKTIMEFSFGEIGLSFDIGVENEDGMHEILRRITRNNARRTGTTKPRRVP